MGRIITEKFDEKGRLVERVTQELDDEPAVAPAYQPFTYPVTTDHWWVAPNLPYYQVYCGTTTSDRFTIN